MLPHNMRPRRQAGMLFLLFPPVMNHGVPVLRLFSQNSPQQRGRTFLRFKNTPLTSLFRPENLRCAISGHEKEASAPHRRRPAKKISRTLRITLCKNHAAGDKKQPVAIIAFFYCKASAQAPGFSPEAHLKLIGISA